jgi:hypothetical protein
MTNFSARLTHFTGLLLQSRDYRYWERKKKILVAPPLQLRKHADLGAYDFAKFAPCDISLSSLSLPALEAGDFVELIIRYL